jgi:hypothetical protein
MGESSENSFLHETERNKGITSEMRRKIEERFCRSKVNKIYRFPRLSSEEDSVEVGRFNRSEFREIHKMNSGVGYKFEGYSQSYSKKRILPQLFAGKMKGKDNGKIRRNNNLGDSNQLCQSFFFLPKIKMGVYRNVLKASSTKYVFE